MRFETNDAFPSPAHRPVRAARRALAGLALLALLLAGCGGTERSAAAAAGKTEPLPAAVARAEAARSNAIARRDALRAAPEFEENRGLIDRLIGRRVSRSGGADGTESPRDRFIRLKADQTVHIRRGGFGDAWHRRTGVTPAELQALEDEFWLDPEVRSAVLARIQAEMNRNRRPLR